MQLDPNNGGINQLRFPLVLSCGHKAHTHCKCWGERSTSPDGDSQIDRVLREFQGAWRQTLEGYGCHLPSGRHHGPCPVCGGKDRFRFDDKDGRGTWFCSQCEPQSGGGLLLLARYLGKPTIEIAKELLGQSHERSRAPVRIRASDDQIRKANHEQARRGAAMLLASAVMRQHPYMDRKGLAGEWLTNGDPIMGKEGIIEPESLLLVPAYKADGDGSALVNMQKITTDGTKRPLFGGDMTSVYHKLDGHTKCIGIAEGFATGVTVHRCTGATVYCAFNTGNLAAVAAWVASQHPGVSIVIFADNDEHGAGEKYAKEAAAPINATVAMPAEVGDWDDYRQAHGIEATKAAMRAAIKADRELCAHAPAPASNPDMALDEAPIVEPTQPMFEPVQPFGFTIPAPAAPASQAPVKQSKPAKETDLPPGITLDGMDIDQPPGLAGRIVDYMRDGANRQLNGGAYSAMALQCMAMAGAGLPGLGGTKLSLITLTLGMSAAGKEFPQRVVKQLLDAHGKTIYGDIRSDKDIIRSAIYDNGHCFYVVDEAQKILSSNTSQNKHMSNVISTLMELSTTSCYKLSQLHRDEFLTHIEAAKSRVEKQIQAKRESITQLNQEHEGPQIKRLELDIANMEGKLADHDRRALTAKNGVTNPALHLLAYSTPQKLASIVDEDSIESGFLGRALINDCGVERAPQQLTIATLKAGKKTGVDLPFEMLKAQIGLICQLVDDSNAETVEGEYNGTDFDYVITPEAEADLNAIMQHYDQYHYRNHPRVGAIYARLVERVLSLSSIMALGNITNDGKARVDRPYVRYALMLTLQSLEHLTSNLKINEGATQETIEAKLEAVQTAIIKRLTVDKKDDADGWRYKSKIKDYLKRQKYYQRIQKELAEHNQDAFENALMMLGSKVEIDQGGKQVRLRR